MRRRVPSKEVTQPAEGNLFVGMDLKIYLARK